VRTSSTIQRRNDFTKAAVWLDGDLMKMTEPSPTDEQIHLTVMAEFLKREGKHTSAKWCVQASEKIGELMKRLAELEQQKITR
jgi:ribonucleotide reductase beta subunit family protein with ferritin-like domain